MAELATVSQVLQLGLETTPGTDVAANKQLTMMDIMMGIRGDMQSFRPQGFKYQTTKALNKEWAEGGVSGGASYNEIVYALASVLCREVITGAGAAKTWTFSPSSTAPDTIATYTIERGDATRAHQNTYCHFNSFSVEATRDGGVTVGGTVVGRALEDAITLTATPTVLLPIPIVSDEWAIFVDTSLANLGTTRYTRVKRVRWEIADRQRPHWFLDNTQTSFGAIVEGVPTCQMSILLEADAAGMGLLTGYRAEETKFIRFKATGAAISGGGNYDLQLDMSAKCQEPSEYSDEDGLYAIEFTFDATHDTTATWVRALRAIVVNTLTAL